MASVYLVLTPSVVVYVPSRWFSGSFRASAVSYITLASFGGLWQVQVIDAVAQRQHSRSALQQHGQQRPQTGRRRRSSSSISSSRAAVAVSVLFTDADDRSLSPIHVSRATFARYQ